MLKSKIVYFCLFAALASLLPFLAIYYNAIGLSGKTIGLLTGIPPLITLAAAPLWGGWADATNQHKRLLMLAMGAALAVVFVLSHAATFLWLLPLVMAYAFVSAPIIPLVDNSVLELLGARRAEYGKVRLWGSVGWGVVATLIGVAIQRTGLQWAFYGYLIFMGGALLVVASMHVSSSPIGGAFWQGLRLFARSRAWGVFLATAFLIGVAMGVTNNFLLLRLQGMGAGEGLMGLSMLFATFSELPVFFFADRFLKRWGARWVLLGAIFLYAVRMFAYAAMPATWMVLPINLLHGLTFAAAWAAGVAYAHDLAPEGMGATAQGLFNGMTMGLGAATGAFIGGLLYDGVGAAAMFMWVGIGLLIGALGFALAARKEIERG